MIRISNTKKYKNGDKYIGEFINGIKNGKGILYYNPNDINKRNRYEGNFKDNKREGKGTLYYKKK